MTSFKTNTYSIKSEGKSFYWASFFLPKKNRIAASRLYSICRYLDDVADNSKLDTSSQIKNIFNQIKENESSEINIFFKQNNINLGWILDFRQTFDTKQSYSIKNVSTSYEQDDDLKQEATLIATIGYDKKISDDHFLTFSLNGSQSTQELTTFSGNIAYKFAF